MVTTNFDTQFWRDIASGYEQVARNNELEITVERENKRAMIKANKGIIIIMIDDAPNEKPPTLIVPAGQGGN
jgi:hypothetical protein